MYKISVEKRRLQQRRGEVQWWKRNRLFEHREARTNKKEALLTRGLYRHYSRIWKKNCPIEEMYKDYP